MATTGNPDTFLNLHREFNRRERRGATQRETSDIAKEASYENGSKINYMFSCGWMVTRDDGRWVVDLL